MKKQISKKIFDKFLDHVPELPEYKENATGDWIRCHSRLPWLQLDIEIPAHTILQEINNIKHLLTMHRDDYAEHSGWSSFCLHGKAYNATREDDYYNDDRSYTWTPEAKELMPKTVKFFQHWPTAGFQRLRVMHLAPGGWISVHSDTRTSMLNPINIAITQPDNCAFVMDRYGRVPFKVGQAILLDVSNLHTIFNNSDQDRWHLIAHQRPSPEFDDLVVKSYKILYNKHNETMHYTNSR